MAGRSVCLRVGGERLFARHYFGDRLPWGIEAFFNDVLLAADPGLTSVGLAGLRGGRSGRRTVPGSPRRARLVAQYAGRLRGVVPADDGVDVLPARRIKSVAPGVRIVFGGAACEGPMGIELIGQFPEIDYVRVGEADAAFRGLSSRFSAAAVICRPGLSAASRSAAASFAPMRRTRAPFTRDLDGLAYPTSTTISSDSPARRCARRWTCSCSSRRPAAAGGARSTTRFLRLNGSTLSYRSKTPRRAVDEPATSSNAMASTGRVPPTTSSTTAISTRSCPKRGEDLDLAFVFEMKTNRPAGRPNCSWRPAWERPNWASRRSSPRCRLIGKGRHGDAKRADLGGSPSRASR